MRPDTVPLKLINDVVTRWNSTFFMFDRLVKIQEPLEAAMGVLRTDLVRIISDEWTTMAEICEILQPFAQITAELSAEKNVTGTASKVIILFLFLVSMYRKKSTFYMKIIRIRLLALVN